MLGGRVMMVGMGSGTPSPLNIWDKVKIICRPTIRVIMKVS
jgi:hypothetical protein